MILSPFCVNVFHHHHHEQYVYLKFSQSVSRLGNCFAWLQAEANDLNIVLIAQLQMQTANWENRSRLPN